LYGAVEIRNGPVGCTYGRTYIVPQYFQLDQGDSEETVRELIIEAVQNTDTNDGVC
jgi:hypothetical protein